MTWTAVPQAAGFAARFLWESARQNQNSRKAKDRERRGGSSCAEAACIIFISPHQVLNSFPLARFSCLFVEIPLSQYDMSHEKLFTITIHSNLKLAVAPADPQAT
eukprot:452859-Rhodomonas_salina.2